MNTVKPDDCGSEIDSFFTVGSTRPSARSQSMSGRQCMSGTAAVDGRGGGGGGGGDG